MRVNQIARKRMSNSTRTASELSVRVICVKSAGSADRQIDCRRRPPSAPLLLSAMFAFWTWLGWRVRLRGLSLILCTNTSSDLPGVPMQSGRCVAPSWPLLLLVPSYFLMNLLLLVFGAVATVYAQTTVIVEDNDPRRNVSFSSIRKLALTHWNSLLVQCIQLGRRIQPAGPRKWHCCGQLLARWIGEGHVQSRRGTSSVRGG